MYFLQLQNPSQFKHFTPAPEILTFSTNKQSQIFGASFYWVHHLMHSGEVEQKILMSIFEEVNKD